MLSASSNIDFHIVSHCNLNCAYCSHFSSVAEKELMSLASFEKDLVRWHTLDIPVDCFTLLGGEPLLHPLLLDFVKCLYEHFPSVRRRINTNGLLLDRQDASFFKCLEKTNTEIRWSVYPLKIDKEKILNLTSNITVELVDKTLFHKGCLDLSGKHTPQDSFDQCFFRGCPCIHNGKYHNCFVSANFRHLNKFFKLNMVEPEGFDLHKGNKQSLMEYSEQPIDFCRYCNFNNSLTKQEWKLTQYSLSEFTI